MILMLILLLMPLAGLHFCVGLDPLLQYFLSKTSSLSSSGWSSGILSHTQENIEVFSHSQKL
jgi:hypothetical protein